MYINYANESAIESLIMAFSSVLAVYSAISFIIWLIELIGYWKVYRKAGEHGWASLIPFYSTFVLYRITWKNGWLFLIPVILGVIIPFAAFSMNAISGLVIILCAIGSFVMKCMTSNKLAKAFGYGTGFTLGLIFLSFIFVPVLGFGKTRFSANTSLIP